jgi:signal transduction histidine kinase
MTLEVDAASGLGARLDPEALRQVVANLVDNAIKYGPTGQRVRLGAERAEDGLRLFVEDQGPGIPRGERERVWGRFERLERDRHSSVAGTGIGLAVVRETAERCGGRAWIEDAAPTGTRVVVLLPQAAPEAAPRASALPEPLP